jgi:hypothetical protein
MKLPSVEDPRRYQGLYVYDWGEWTALGYTAEEVAALLESEQTRGGRIYRVVRAQPDGTMELRGISADRFRLESGVFFNRSTLADARQDFAALRELGAGGAPCRAFLQLADRGVGGEGWQYVTALIYPAEFDDDVGQWLLQANCVAGDYVEGGASLVTRYYEEAHEILERASLWSQSAIPSRSHDELIRTFRQAVQR